MDRSQARIPRRLVDLLGADERFAAAIVFGSVVRGTPRPDSDLDLGVLYTDAESRIAVEREWLSVAGSLAIAAGRDVHLVDLEAADPALRRSVFETGQVILDRSPGRLRDLKVATGLEYLDWAYARKVADAGHDRRLGVRHG